MLRAGYAVGDITPRGPLPDLNGFASRIQPARRIAAPVLARVLVLESSRPATRVVIAVCDLVGFRQPDSVRLEQAIARAAKIPLANVLLACTHNHSGPMSMPLGLIGKFRPAYLRLIEKQLIGATQAALADRQVVTEARSGSRGIADLGEYRCCTDLPGRKRWPGRVTALRLERERGGPVTLFHAGIHPYLLGWESRLLHPDFPGPACASLGKAIFLPGCGADVSPVPAFGRKLSEVQRYGKRLARAAEEALASGRRVNLEPLHARVSTLVIRFGFLPAGVEPRHRSPPTPAYAKSWPKYVRNHRVWERELRAGKLPRTARLRLHFLRLGDVNLAGIPAEVFGQTGLELTKRCGVLAVTHAGGNWGYLPRSFAYKRKTYEAATAHHWYRTAGGMALGTDARVQRFVARAVRKL